MAHLGILAFFFIQFCRDVVRSSPISSRKFEHGELLAFSSYSSSSGQLYDGFAKAKEERSARLEIPAVRVGGGRTQTVGDASEVETESFLYQHQEEFEDIMEASPQPDPEIDLQDILDILFSLPCSGGQCSSDNQTQLRCDISDLRDDENLPLSNGGEGGGNATDPSDEGILTILDTPPVLVRLTTAENDENAVLCGHRELSSSNSAVLVTPEETATPDLAGLDGTDMSLPISTNGTEGSVEASRGNGTLGVGLAKFTGLLSVLEDRLEHVAVHVLS